MPQFPAFLHRFWAVVHSLSPTTDILRPGRTIVGAVTNYATVLRTPGLARLLLSQLVARFPAGMLSLAILMHVEDTYSNFTSAGVVLAALSIGQAVSGPVAGRLMTVWGMRPVLLVTMVACALSLTALALWPPVLWQASILAVVAGLTIPPVSPAVRTIYPKVVNAAQLSRLFSLDASLQEVIWVIGPVATTAVAFAISPAAGILVAAGILLLGGLWFVAAPEVGKVRIPKSRRRAGAVLRNPVVVLMSAIGALLVGACSAIEAAVVAEFGHERPETGILLAVFAVGSLVGGLAFGHLPLAPISLARRMGIVFLGIGLALLSTNPIWLGAAFFVSGLGIAPVFSGSFSAVSSSVRFSESAESYGWMATGQLIGAAAGSALAGIANDVAGSLGGFLISAAFALLGAAVALIWRRSIPDLRGTDIAPRLDTEPMNILNAPS